MRCVVIAAIFLGGSAWAQAPAPVIDMHLHALAADDQGNVISYNSRSGIVISGEGAVRNEIFNNFIGSADDGETELGNERHGILILEEREHGGGGASPAAEHLGSQGTFFEEPEHPEGYPGGGAETQRLASARGEPHPAKRPGGGSRGNGCGEGDARGTEHGLGFFA